MKRWFVLFLFVLPTISIAATPKEVAEVIEMVQTRSVPLLDHCEESILQTNLGTTVQLSFEGVLYDISISDSNIPVLIVMVDIVWKGQSKKYRMADIGATGKVSLVFTFMDSHEYIAAGIEGLPPLNLEHAAFWQEQFDRATQKLREYRREVHKT